MAPRPAIGIDLGTSYSCVGILKPEGIQIIVDSQGKRTVPSYVAFTEVGCLIGEVAKNQVARNPRNTIFDLMRLIGRRYNDPSVQEDVRRWPFTVKADSNGKAVIEVTVKGEQRIFHPEEISAMILRKMKKIAETHIGQGVTEAVITVPAYFNQAQRQATKAAARIAGLNEIHLCNEPSAAALAYTYNKKSEDGERRVLIFNLGGGTLDVSLVVVDGGIVKVIATAGDTHMGGEDFDNRLVDCCVQDIKERHGVDLSTNARAVRRLKTACELAKKTLSSETQASIDIDGLLDGKDYSITVTRARFEDLCKDYFSKLLRPIEQVLRDSRVSKSGVDEILLVGGSTRIPKVHKLIKVFFHGKEPSRSINPDEAVAYGAAARAVILTDSDKGKDLLLLDAIPLSVGVETAGGAFSEIIERNYTIPIKRDMTLTTDSDNQTSLSLRLLEGKEQADNNIIGKLHLNGIPPAPRGVSKIQVVFDVDGDGFWKVSAFEKTSGTKLTVIQEFDYLFEKEIDRMIEDAENFWAADQAIRMRLEARNRLESYICQIENSLIKKCNEVRSWLDSNSLADKAAYDAKQEELEAILMDGYQALSASEGGTGNSKSRRLF